MKRSTNLLWILLLSMSMLLLKPWSHTGMSDTEVKSHSPVSQPLTFHVGAIVENESAKQGQMVFGLFNSTERDLSTWSFGAGTNSLFIELPNGKIYNDVTFARLPPGFVFPVIPLNTQQIWTQNMSDIIPYFASKPLPGLYRLRWKWEEVVKGDADVPLEFQSEPVALLLEPAAIPAPPPSPMEQMYEKPIDEPGDPDAPSVPKPTTLPPKARAPLEMAVVVGAPATTVAFIFTNQAKTNTAVAPLGSEGNGFTVVTPTNGIVRQPLQQIAVVNVKANEQKIWKSDVSAFFKARQLNAAGWYQLFWKMGELKTGPPWLYKVPDKEKAPDAPKNAFK